MSDYRWIERAAVIQHQEFVCRSGRLVRGTIELDVISGRIAARLKVAELSPPTPSERLAVGLRFSRDGEGVHVPVAWTLDLSPESGPVSDFVLTPFRPDELRRWAVSVHQPPSETDA